MNDILPPKRSLGKPGSDVIKRSKPQPAQAPPASLVSSTPEPVETPPSPPKERKTKRIFLWVLGGFLLLVLIVCTSAYFWYKHALSPANSNDQNKIQIEIAAGTSPDTIGMSLEEKKIIKSQLAFDIYTRLTGTRSKLQAGTYKLSPSESTEAIVEHLVAGRADQLTLTFLPGATLAENKKVLTATGFKEADVTEAVTNTYNHPLFADKPAGTDLEGYIYGETYTFGSNATMKQILGTTFDHYYDVIEKDGLIEGFKKHNLNLYQGITLASIIQREEADPTDQKQIAQVFLRRLSIGMPLGADPTYKYAAKKLGVTPTPELDSPYNTRKYPGLPPGPIATPGRSALNAVANPAAGDYLYFLSGDDDVTYFAHTAEEHEANIRDHCQVKCSVF